jgi:carbonic anhydrase/acetyltransferase-like protein (isoleucine patch superfamily)
MTLYALGDRVPEIHPEAFVHPDAVIIGAVVLGPEATVWPTAVLRGDHGAIRVGARTSIQDGTVIHCTSTLDTVIGDDCVVEDGCLIGSGSVVLQRVLVRSGALVAAGAVVSPGTEVPSRAMALGVPARIKPDAVEAGSFDHAVATYIRNNHWYRRDLRRID